MLRKKIKSTLNPGENVIWQDKPQFFPALITDLILGLLGFIGLFYFATSLNILVLILSLVLIFVSINSYLAFRSVKYLLTDQKLVLCRGVVKCDFDLVDFDKIKNIWVDFSLFDKIFGGNSGTINFDTMRGVRHTDIQLEARRSSSRELPHFKLAHIKNPNHVFELLKQATNQSRFN